MRDTVEGAGLPGRAQTIVSCAPTMCQVVIWLFCLYCLSPPVGTMGWCSSFPFSFIKDEAARTKVAAAGQGLRHPRSSTEESRDFWEN